MSIWDCPREPKGYLAGSATAGLRRKLRRELRRNLAEFDGLPSNTHPVDKVPDKVFDEGTKGKQHAVHLRRWTRRGRRSPSTGSGQAAPSPTDYSMSNAACKRAYHSSAWSGSLA